MENGNRNNGNEEGKGRFGRLMDRLQGLPFLVPTVLVAAVIALVVSSYEPLVFDADAYSSSQAYADDLVAVEVDEDASSSGDVATVEYSESDYAVDTSNLQDGVYTGSAYGYRSTITVEVTIENGIIVSIEVISEDEDEAYFSMAKQVISSIIAAQSTSVDTISGATYSSRGILAAVANALAKAQGSSTVYTTIMGTSVEGSTAASRTVAQSLGIVISESDLVDGVYTGSCYGYKSLITVRVTVEDGKIASIEVISEGDDPAYFNPAWKQIVADILDSQSTDVDVYSGATYSSEGIIYAVEDALSQAIASSGSDTEDDGVSDDGESGSAAAGSGDSQDGSDGDVVAGAGSSDSSTDADADDGSEDADDGVRYLDGTYTAYALCGEDGNEDFDPYYVVVTVTIEDGIPVSISDYYGTNDVGDGEDILSDYDEDNEDYLWWAAEGRTTRTGTWQGVISQLIDDLVDALSIEVVSGATYSSNAIAEAYSNALDQAAAAYVAAQAELADGDSGSSDGSGDASADDGSEQSLSSASDDGSDDGDAGPGTADADRDPDGSSADDGLGDEADGDMGPDDGSDAGSEPATDSEAE